MKLFVLTKPPKDDLLEILPFLLGKAVYLILEKHIKNGKLLMKSGDTEMDLYSFVNRELNGFAMSHIFLVKNMRKYLQNPRLESD